MARRLRYVAAEKDPLYLHALTNRFLRTPNVTVVPLDPESKDDYSGIGEPFDTALCVNVLEYLERPEKTVANLAGVLRPGGMLIALVPQGKALYGPLDAAMLIALVPQGKALYGPLDAAMGHARRFQPEEMRKLMADNNASASRC